MYEELFSQRLAQLRIKSGMSARDMSLSLGQNPGYINTIENGKAFPTMTNFFYICDFLHITPKEFFDIGSENPQKLQELTEQMKLLDERQIDAISDLVNGLVQKP